MIQHGDAYGPPFASGLVDGLHHCYVAQAFSAVGRWVTIEANAIRKGIELQR